MPKILDRYLVREILPPFLLSLLVLTFVLEIPPLAEQAEKLIAKGVDWPTVLRVLATLLPQALGITIPMSLLLGILIGLGRLSGDREYVAIQACGVSVFRLLSPIGVLAVVAWSATSYVLIVSLPAANQTYREIVYSIVSARAEGDVKPRVFFDDFPDRVLYVRDLEADGGWRDVFLADSTRPNETTVYFARDGHLLLNSATRSVQLLLTEGTRHTTLADKPEQYEGSAYQSVVLNLDPETVFPHTSLIKGEPEMTIAELHQSIAEATKRGEPTDEQEMMIQKKFSIPIACLVLALLGLGLGVTNRKDGKLASFVLGIIVIFIYYVLLWMPRAMAKGQLLSAALAPWIPNIVLGIAGVAAVIWRAQAADQPIRITLPFLGSWFAGKHEKTAVTPSVPQLLDATTSVAVQQATDLRPAEGQVSSGRREGVVVVIRIPHLRLPRPPLLDLYVGRSALYIFVLAFVGLLGIFYISTFIDLSDKLFRGTATSEQLIHYLYYETPQFVYYIIPIATLISALVAIGLLTKNSELIVMKACGVSLYRTAVPIVLLALLGGAALFGLDEQVTPYTNRRADAIRHVMRGLPAQTFDVLERRWLMGHDGDIYHYAYFDPRSNRFSQLTVFHVSDNAWRLAALTYAPDVLLASQEDDPQTDMWSARRGWTREFTTIRRKSVVKYAAFTERDLMLEPPSYFKTEEPEAERMTYGQLKRYVGELQASGFQVVPYLVALQRKLAFPFVTLVMTLIAVPFAVTTGRRGALYGIGVGIILAIVYWLTLSTFAALGSGGVITPFLAAWAPNFLFGACACYLVLTVRT